MCWVLEGKRDKMKKFRDLKSKFKIIILYQLMIVLGGFRFDVFIIPIGMCVVFTIASAVLGYLDLNETKDKYY